MRNDLACGAQHLENEASYNYRQPELRIGALEQQRLKEELVTVKIGACQNRLLVRIAIKASARMQKPTMS